jgi:hypothetical protein
MKNIKMMVTIIVIALLFVGQVKSSVAAYTVCMGVCFAILTACTGAGAGATVASGGVAAPAAIAIRLRPSPAITLVCPYWLFLHFNWLLIFKLNFFNNNNWQPLKAPVEAKGYPKQQFEETSPQINQ